MSRLRAQFLKIAAGTLAILIAQDLLLWWMRALRLPVFLVLAGLVLVTGALALVVLFFYCRSLQGNAPDALLRWLRSIDLNRESRPRPALDVEVEDHPLVEAVDELVARVYRYRDRLLVRHQRVQRLLRNVTDVLYHADANARLTWVTDSVTEMLGYTPAELEGRKLEHLLVDPDKDLARITQSVQLLRHPVRVYRRDRSIAWLLISARRIEDAQGRPLGSEGVCRDGTRLIETQQALSQEKERAQAMLASIGDGVVATDANGLIEYLNPRAEDMLGIDSETAIGQRFDNICHLIDTDTQEEVDGLVSECIIANAVREWDDNLELVGSPAQNGGQAVKIAISPMRDSEHAVTGAVIVLHDISRLKEISQEMAYQANHDLLTGLPNRRAFEHLLRQFLQEARDSGIEHAMCYIDLDQFKLVNDTCGHNAGDEMLRQLTAHLASSLRASDTLARLGGDEFGVIMRNLTLAEAQAKAEILRAEIDAFRFRWEDNLFRLGASIGVAAIDYHALSATELLRRADTACYLAKEKGRNQVYVYHGDSDETQTRHGDMQRMQQISDALDNDRFVLYAQLIRPLNFRAGMSVGVELLLRVRGDNDEILSPQTFLITAERYNIAPRIDRWVLQHSLELIAAAGDAHASIDHYSINISGQSITDENFVGFARDIIEQSSVDPRRLVFEITETTAVTNTRRASELMRTLRKLGCRFSLDDFGSGLSSFSYLKNLPSDFIKIDGKLVRNILHDPVERSIVEAINRVGRAMHQKTVAEHVESPALLAALDEIGVDYVQGYHVARPLPFENLPQVLESTSAGVARDA